ncbi:WYL domain protein [Tepidimonas sediminis]|uniref:WYL domain protein n=1 Tax=Tepidimonas sediminis TaxID=2588941 RepID=A0A554WUY1_9BURK|nr:YafY family protein [Tepidimonas sediminis]TSE27368.1 WYL domain protein [Tepidimonas sediminis]
MLALWAQQLSLSHAADTMDRTERFYRIDALLQSQRVVTFERLQEALQVSRATLRRDLAYLRDRLGAPIVWDRQARGYRYQPDAHEPVQPLPGLWFNAQEAHALLLMQALLEQLQPTLLKPHIEPLRARLRALLETGQHAAEDVQRRVRLLTAGQRPVPQAHFELVASAVLQRRQLELHYYVRARDEHSQRRVCPQMLLYHRGGWYLLAWCHLRQGLRSFALEAIEQVQLLDAPACEVEPAELEAFIGQGYGIFSGTQVRWAQLRFAPERARWVACETWHPRQQQRWCDDGTLQLRVPYTDLRELAMEVLRHGAQVEVEQPAELRALVAEELRAALRRYDGGHGTG